MIDLDIRPCFDTIARKSYVADRPIDFETWLTLAQDLDTELVRGVIKERKPALYAHEWLFAEEKPDEFTVTKNLIEGTAED